MIHATPVLLGNDASMKAALKRDYSNVHADVQALISAGLLGVSKAGVRPSAVKSPDWLIL
jgi:hypothetical protein